MRSLPVLLSALTLVVAPLSAQDTAVVAPRREALRTRIEQNFLARVKEELSLTDDQSTKLVDVNRRTVEKRRALEAENRRLNTALAAQMRPGVAADPRLLRRTLDSLVDIRVAAAQVYKDEQRELATFLSDVQRAQFYVLRERLLNRMDNVRAARAPAAPPARAGRRQP
ncbi:MAG TPA: Spy/CpxP family protein refolding chaperone [Gemmatimonadales bacterium]|nr:Spy/CpxP family protein refolding chaperone [Gemmatimonadales bacterium]